jgi:hypothetical protein
MSDEELKAELERLRNEKRRSEKGSFIRHPFEGQRKGAVSVYGMGRFPVTLYKEQWLKPVGYVGRYSRVHCRKRSAVEGKGLKAD